jgi:DNA repair protein RadC
MTDLIRDLPLDDRPRERMLRHGAGTLSNAELAAILIGSGTRGRNAIQVARELLKHGGFKALRNRDPRDFAKIPGLGDAKLARVWAAMELAWRLMADEPEEPERVLYEANVIGRALVAQYANERQERLGLVLLDARHRILKQQEIYIGTINNALVSTREIITTTLMENGVGIVVFHNHPSGSPVPSEEDLAFTAKLGTCLATCDIELVDHLILGSHGYYSMKERGKL